MEKEKIFTEEELYWIGGGSTGTLPNRVTPSKLDSLKQNEIFVFGSNPHGMHSNGTARIAYNEFGAEWGNKEGLQGQSYAIPTMEGRVRIKESINIFTDFAKKHSDLIFFVTPIGCCNAGYDTEEIAPFFIPASLLKNVFLPISFWKVLLNLKGEQI